MPLTTSKPLRGRRSSRQNSAATHAVAGKNPMRLAGNFAALSSAEVVCRAVSVAVTLNLAKRLGTAGYGRIEFAFNLVCWLVLLVREGIDVIAAREIARHPRLIRPLVNQVLAIRLVVASLLVVVLAVIGWLVLPGTVERSILYLYGMLLFTTALGLDFVYRGLERMGLLAVSMCLRTAVYALSVAVVVLDPARILWVPVLLVVGEATGIALVWFWYTRRFGLPCPALRGGRFLWVFLRRGRTIYLIQVSQAAVLSVDVLIVGLMTGWSEVGVYSASHRMVAAMLTFGMIFQQVAFPSLARSWRGSNEGSRQALDALVRVLATAFVPIVVGTTVLAGPLVDCLLGPTYGRAAPLLALEIWRAPLLSLAFLYQSALIALNRESAGVRLLLCGAIGSIPLTALLLAAFGLQGAPAASVVTGLVLAAAGYLRLRLEGRQPAWHHQLARPLAATTVMVGACLLLTHIHVLIAVPAGAIVYVAALWALGGLRRHELLAIMGRT